jgi:2-polyprenyl-3-methyl-5-hydroxy-6-metoxy-1,4-benzoquinol methylase
VIESTRRKSDVTLFSMLARRGGDPRTSTRNQATCPYCGGAANFLIASTDRNRHTTRDVFDYFRCPVCHLVFMDPIHQDLRPFYAGGYREIPQSLDDLRSIAAQETYRLDPVLALKQQGRLLEVGPWMGVFSHNAKQAGFEVTAIEMDQDCVQFLNGTVGVRALQSDDPAATLASLSEEFDVIALWHCLEHLRQPWHVLESAAQRLAPGGILLVALPNIESLEFALLRASWRNLDAPRHLYFLPQSLLRQIAKGLGLVEQLFTTTDPLSHAFSTETWHHITEALVPFDRGRYRTKQTLKSIANHFEARNNSGPGLTAIFQRPL